jgi:hypothetical protein
MCGMLPGPARTGATARRSARCLVVARCFVMAALLCVGGGAQADTRLLIVSGIGGEESYSQQFRDWALQMRDAAVEQVGLAPQDVRWLCESPQRDPVHCAGESRRERVLSTIVQLLDDAPAHRPLMVLLIGHGTTRDGRALFNVAGPDLSARDLDEVLSRDPALLSSSAQPSALSAATSSASSSAPSASIRRVAVVNTAPASAPFTELLAGRGRIVITATARSAENDHTRFAAHFVAAYTNGSADADRDGRVSLLEAFRFAVKEVAREYADKRQVSTEHALLDDNADGQGSRRPDADAVPDEAGRRLDAQQQDGAAAAQFYLAAAVRREEASPARIALETQARELVARVGALRRRKAAMAPEEYAQQLEALLVELAMNRRSVRGQGS